MSDTQKVNELFKKIATLERRVSKLELGLHELDTVVDPEGWIGEAFERVEEDIIELKNETNQKFTELSHQLDIILKHLTGMNRAFTNDL